MRASLSVSVRSSSSFSFPSATYTSSQARTWAYASTSASSSPIASSPPPYGYAFNSSPTRDTAHIRRHPSPPHAAHHALKDHDQDIAWRHDLLDVDKPYPSSSLSTLYNARYTRYAYGYAMPRSASFAMSSDSEEPPATSDFDVASGYSEDMDVDAGASAFFFNLHFLSC